MFVLATVVLHALVTAADPGGHSLRIVHDPFPGMNMRMEMPTYEPNARDARVPVGTRVRLRCDTTTQPWVCRDLVREGRRMPSAAPAPAAAMPALPLPR